MDPSVAPRRFSDAELAILNDSHHALVSKVDNHIVEENAFRILQEERSSRRDGAIETLLVKIDDLQKCITLLEEKVEKLDSSTSGMVTLFNESKVGKLWLIRVGKLALWLGSVYAAFKLFASDFHWW